jgi:hypothetical protein
MLGVESVAERMANHLVSHHATMPSVRKTAQAVVAACCLEDSFAFSHDDNAPLSMQDDGRGESSWAARSNGTCSVWLPACRQVPIDPGAVSALAGLLNVKCC